mgnify:CR=1 FL=1
MQRQADILQDELIVSKLTETTGLGAAFMAGLATGFFPNIEYINKLNKNILPGENENFKNKQIKVCGKDKCDDASFNIKNMMCNKHMVQVKRYGKPLDNLPSIDKSKRTKICSVCGIVDNKRSSYWLKEGDYYGKELCGKHYNQMNIHGVIIDASPSELKSREPVWTDDELNILRDCYSKYMSLKEIAKTLKRTEGAVSLKAQKLGLCNEYIRKNSSHFKDVYQDYDWLKERYIDKLMTPEEIAIEANTTPRTIRKWCERHKLYQIEAKRAIHLTDLQHDLIMFSLLGDGHVDKRETQPVFIVSHAENQKDYLYWKYDILKSICNSEPSYIKESTTYFGDKQYKCQSNYRISTRIINELIPIRSMSKSDIINSMTEFGLAIQFSVNFSIKLKLLFIILSFLLIHQSRLLIISATFISGLSIFSASMQAALINIFLKRSMLSFLYTHAL